MEQLHRAGGKRAGLCHDGLANADLDAAYQQVYDDVTAHPELAIHQMSMSYGEGETDTTYSQVKPTTNIFWNWPPPG